MHQIVTPMRNPMKNTQKLTQTKKPGVPRMTTQKFLEMMIPQAHSSANNSNLGMNEPSLSENNILQYR